jgi:hypothetical protein
MYPPPSVPARAQSRRRRSGLPYETPPWGRPPHLKSYLEVLRGGAHLETVKLGPADADGTFLVIGRADCDVVCGHASVSRYHAVLQFGTPTPDFETRQESGVSGCAFNLYLYDLGSTHGTRRNKRAVAAREFVRLEVGDHLSFGESSRIYIVSCEEVEHALGPVRILNGKDPVARSEESENDMAARIREEAMILALDASVKKRDAIASEIDFIQGKAAIQDLTTGQNRQIDALGRKVEKLNSEIQSREDVLRITSHDPPDGFEASAVRYKNDVDNTPDVDDVKDRTHEQNVASYDQDGHENCRSGSTETLESLSAKLKDLEAMIARRMLKLRKCKAEQRGEAQLGSGDEGGSDTLDAFMAQNERELLSHERARAQGAYDNACDEYNRIKRMVAAAAMGSDFLQRVPVGSSASHAVADEKDYFMYRGNATARRPQGPPPTLSVADADEKEDPSGIARKRPRSEDLSTGRAKKSGPSISSTSREYEIDEDDGYQMWVPPPDQTGDGNTALNVKYGY